MSQLTTVQTFYNDQNIFITGVTGFLGSVLLEKVLRSCPGIRKIYVLIRGKKDRDHNERLSTEILSNEIFDHVRRVIPDMESKIISVNGDIARSNLGIADADVQELIGNVNIIFHCAATVQFNCDIVKSIKSNVVSVRDLLQIARRMTRLKAFIHVSTAYSHCPRNEIEEIFYPNPCNPDRLIEEIEGVNLHTESTKRMIEKWPNTYTFSKALAEEVIRINGQKLPIAIVRPSIVGPAAKEPLPGWINNYNGSAGVYAFTQLGYLHVLNLDNSVNMDIVPVDYLVNFMITLASEINKKRNQSVLEHQQNEISIYNYANNFWKPLSGEMLIKCNKKYGRKYPTNKQTSHVFCFHSKSAWKYWVYLMIFQILPAFFSDLVSLASGKRTRYLKMAIKMITLNQFLKYFTTRTWQFSITKTIGILNVQETRDSNLFNFNMANLVWDDYFRDYALGIRQYLLNDPPKTIPQAIEKATKFKKERNLFVLSVVMCAALLLVFLFSGL